MIERQEKRMFIESTLNDPLQGPSTHGGAIGWKTDFGPCVATKLVNQGQQQFTRGLNLGRKESEWLCFDKRPQ